MDRQFKLSITLGNDAMQHNEDIAEALRQVAHRIDSTDERSGLIFDLNGNRVGGWEMSA